MVGVEVVRAVLGVAKRAIRDGVLISDQFKLSDTRLFSPGGNCNSNSVIRSPIHFFSPIMASIFLSKVSISLRTLS